MNILLSLAFLTLINGSNHVNRFKNLVAAAPVINVEDCSHSDEEAYTDSRYATPRILTSSLSTLTGLRTMNHPVRYIEDDETTSSERSSFRSTGSRKLVKIEDLTTLKSTVDFSEAAVLERLRIYLFKNTRRPIYYELLGNSQVAKLSLFQNLLPDIIETAKRTSSPDPAYTLLATIEAFLHHRVNLREATGFDNAVPVLRKAFKHLDRPFIAFHVLTADLDALKWYREYVNVNLFAVDKALLMLPAKLQIKVARALFKNILAAKLNTRLLKRIFRDSKNTELCDLLIQECEFDPKTHHDCFKDAKLPLGHPKWDYLRSIYGADVIDDGYLMTDQFIKPQDIPKISLPFELRPATEEELQVYDRAYGRLFMAKYHELKLTDKV